MDVLKFLTEHWQALVFVIVIIFNVGVMTTKMKTFVTKAELNDSVKEALADHCPFNTDIKELKEGREKNKEDIINVHTKLHQIDFNVQNICEKLEVKYIAKKNGNG